MHFSYLDTLNKAQQEAVLSSAGPCMIIAGAGAGKTKVLTCRIAYLIQEANILPQHILTLTFTNKAANEMKERLKAIIDSQANYVWIGTFHSIFFKILRIEADTIGYPHHFGIYDANDSKSLLKTIVQEMNLDDQVYKPNLIAARISNAKNRLIDHEAYLNNKTFFYEDEKQKLPLLGKIYQIYTQRCLKAGVMDFDDLLLRTYQLLSTHNNICEKYRKQFKYILIDEFQDTNIAQYKIIRLLVSEKKNICVVGDDSQSIYAFRGAEINNILQFSQHFPQTKLIKLEQNYRSTKNIIQAANTLIAHNKKQIQKNVWTTNILGEKVKILSYANNIEEGNQVTASIAYHKQKYGYNLHDFVILYRTNSQSRNFEEALRKYNIPYQIIGGMSFYQRKEIKDFLAYLRLIANPNDEESFKRIINFPKRGISNNTVTTILQLSNEENKPLFNILENAQSYFSKRIANALYEFLAHIKHLQNMAKTKNIFELTQLVGKTFGLFQTYAKDTTPEGKNRVENLQEFLNALHTFHKEQPSIDQQLDTYLENVSLMTGEEDQKTKDKVRLMTIHAAKGLEFTYVYIVGVEEEIFPSRAVLLSEEALEEERRLFYVALTRAKKQVYCTYVIQRYRFGKLKNCLPSRFLTEIDVKYLEWPQKNTIYNKKVLQNKPKKYVSAMASSTYRPTTAWEVGQKVQHEKFGIGKIFAIEQQKKVIIDFQNFGRKTLFLAYARLEKIG